MPGCSNASMEGKVHPDDEKAGASGLEWARKNNRPNLRLLSAFPGTAQGVQESPGF